MNKIYTIGTKIYFDDRLWINHKYVEEGVITEYDNNTGLYTITEIGTTKMKNSFRAYLNGHDKHWDNDTGKLVYTQYKK